MSGYPFSRIALTTPANWVLLKAPLIVKAETVSSSVYAGSGHILTALEATMAAPR